MKTQKLRIEEKLKKVLESNKKRRVVAYEFIDTLVETLQEYKELFNLSCGAIEIGNQYYIRIVKHIGEQEIENCGIYKITWTHPCWGVNIKDIQGAEFWKDINNILEWYNKSLPLVIDKIEDLSIQTTNKLK